MNFGEVKSTLESLTALVKKAATLDLQEKIVGLREAYGIVNSRAHSFKS